MTPFFVALVFVAVYVGMLLGGIPGLRVDRTGVALLGAIILLAGGGISEREALASVDVPTLALLFALMIVSAQLHLGGFYTWVTRLAVATELSPHVLLAVLVGLSGLLSAVLTNDVVCLAMAPPLIRLCLDRQLNPVPYLIALACSANVGSAATIIGNPQIVLIGESLKLSFNGYLITSLVPVLLGLIVVWLIIVWHFRHDWRLEPTTQLPAEDDEPFLRGQTIKGLLVVGMLVVCFMATDWPREIVALGGAGFLLLNRTFQSRKIVGLIDWPVLLLFIGLFVVNGAFQSTGGTEWLVGAAERAGLELTKPTTLFVVTAVLCNLVSNVPAVMLLLPFAQSPEVGPLLALSSTLSGNLIIVGSVANIIVVEAARQSGIRIDVRTHAKVGVPVTLVTLLIAAAWLAVMS